MSTHPHLPVDRLTTRRVTGARERVDRAARRALPDSLLAVHAHPDDETITSGGLLALLEGRQVTVVTCTRGERGEVIDGPAGLANDPNRLAEVRVSELKAALARLGVRDHLFLDQLEPGLPAATDSGMVWRDGIDGGLAQPAPDAPESAFSAIAGQYTTALARLIRDRRPQVVLTYEPSGGYGHPDHQAAHALTLAAVELAADPVASAVAEQDPWAAPHLWLAVIPGAVARHADRDLRSRFAGPIPAPTGQRVVELPPVDAPLQPVSEFVDRWLASLDGEAANPVPALALYPDHPNMARGALQRVSVEPVLPSKAEALRAYRTQVQAVQVFGELSPGPGVAADAGANPLPEPGAAARGCYALADGHLHPLLAEEFYVDMAGWTDPEADSIDRSRAQSAAAAAAPAIDPSDLTAAELFAADGPPTVATAPIPVPKPRSRRTVVLSLLGGFGTGALVALAGTIFHRALPPVGLIVVLLVLALAAWAIRSVGRFAGMAGFLIGWYAMVAFLVATATWTDTVLIPGSQFPYWGYYGAIWQVGGAVIIVAVALLPPSWFRDRPVTDASEGAAPPPAGSPPEKTPGESGAS